MILNYIKFTFTFIVDSIFIIGCLYNVSIGCIIAIF